MTANDTKYNVMLIELQVEKIRLLEHNNDEKRREINRLKKRIKELEKGAVQVEN